MNTTHEHTKIRLIANVCAFLQTGGVECARLPLHGTDKLIFIGTPAWIAQQLDLATSPSQPHEAVAAAYEHDLLDIVRSICSTAQRLTEMTPQQREHYPSPLSPMSPLFQAASAACVERGYTEWGLAVDGVTYPQPPAAEAVVRAELTAEQYQEILRPVLSRYGMQRYLNGDEITLDPSDYRSIITRAIAFTVTPSAPVSQAPDLAAIRDQVLEEAARKVESFRQTMHIPTMTEVAAAIRAMRGGDQSQKHLPGWERGIATVILSGHQLREALDFINPDGDDDPEQREETLTFGIVKHKADDGAEAVGMCCWNDDTDGVLPLDGAASTPGSEQ